MRARLRRVRRALDRARASADLPAEEVPLGTPLLRSRAAHVGGAALLRGPGAAGAPAWRRSAGRRRGLLRAASDWAAASCGGSWLDRALAGRVETPPERDAAHPARAGGVAPRDRGAHRPAGRPPLLPVARLGPHRAAAGRARPAIARPSAARCRACPITLAGGDPLRDRAHRRGLRRAAARPRARRRSTHVLRRKWTRRLRGGHVVP